jgi:hypothetical protein
MSRVRTCKIERLTSGPNDGSRTLSFFIRPGSRSRPWKFFRPEEVPEFEGAHAWFEIERKGREWIFLRRVDDVRGLS